MSAEATALCAVIVLVLGLIFGPRVVHEIKEIEKEHRRDD